MNLDKDSVEFDLPQNEGPVPSGTVNFSRKLYNRPDVPIGSLEKEAFSELSEWRVMPRGDYGIAFRLGIKEPFLNPEGKLAMLIIIFAEYVFPKNMPMNEESYKKEERILKEMLDKIVIEETYKRRKNISGLIMNPPQYMIQELREKLK